MSRDKKQFYQLGYFVKSKRLEHGITQEQLSKALGYKNGQFVSNLERGIAGVPHEKVGELAKILKSDVEIIIEKMVDDFKINLKDCINMEFSE